MENHLLTRALIFFFKPFGILQLLESSESIASEIVVYKCTFLTTSILQISVEQNETCLLLDNSEVTKWKVNLQSGSLREVSLEPEVK